MRTVLFKYIDGYEIITGFDYPVADPVETAKVVEAEIKTTPEWLAVEAEKKVYADAVAMATASRVSVKTRFNAMLKADKNLSRDDALAKLDISKEKYDWDRAIVAMNLSQEVIKPLAEELEKVRMKLRVEKAVYFEPKAGEVIRTDEEVNALMDAIQRKADNTLIALDGAVVTDNRGIAYYYKVSDRWTRWLVAKLGHEIPSDAVMSGDETERQAKEIERDRVAALPDHIKAEEKADAMADAMAEATGMKLTLEIEGDKSALKKSQAAYKKAVKGIEELYG